MHNKLSVFFYNHKFLVYNLNNKITNNVISTINFKIITGITAYKIISHESKRPGLSLTIFQWFSSCDNLF